MKLIVNKSAVRPCGKMEIMDVEEYKDIVNERIDQFILSFTEEEGLIIPIKESEKEDFPESVEFLYTQRAGLLIERIEHKFHALGVHYFGVLEMFFVEIENSCVQDF